MKRWFITLFAMGLGLGLTQAQQQGPGPGGPTEEPGPGPEQMMPMDSWDVPEEIVVLRDQIRDERQALEASREALLASLREQGATKEDVIVALAQWREDNAAAIESIQTLTEQLRDLIAEYRPENPPVELPPEIIALRDELSEKRQELAESRRQAILALEDPTMEEIRAAIEAWRVENADLIAEVQALAQELRQWFRENRPHRPQPYMNEEMQQRRARFRDNINEVRQLRTQLRTMDPDSPECLEIKAQLRNLLQERKTLMRNKRADEGGVGGDRRPGG